MSFGYVRHSLLNIIARRELIFVLVKKRLRERHIGSVLGMFWSFYTALLPLAAYMLVFFFIAGIKVKGADGPWGYLLFVFSGLVPWVFFSRTITESVTALSSNLDLLRQAIFPMEVISIVNVSETFIHLLLQTGLLLVIVCFAKPMVFTKLLLLPIACLLLHLFCLGLSWIVSLIGFYLQDLKEILATVTQFMIYVTPVLYAKDNIPPRLWFLFQINPMTHVINTFRDILYNPHFEHPESFAIFAGMTLVTFVAGYSMALSAKSVIADLV